MKMIRSFAAALLAAALLAACVSTDSATQSAAPAAAVQQDRKEYPGAAEAKGTTFLTARNKAVMAAVQKAVVDIMGAERETANRKKLEGILGAIVSPHALAAQCS